MVHFALLLLLAQPFLHSGGVMPQERVDFYHAVLKASGMATFPEEEEEVVKHASGSRGWSAVIAAATL